MVNAKQVIEVVKKYGPLYDVHLLPQAGAELKPQEVEMAAPPGLQNEVLTAAFEVLQLKAAALAAEVLLAERTGVSLGHRE